MLTDETAREKILRRVRGFQRIAQSQKGTTEGETAAALVAKNMERYGITEDELKEISIQLKRFQSGAKETWCRVLLAVVARFHDCDATHNTQTGMSTVVGDKPGITVTIKKHKALRKAVEKAFKAWSKDCELAHAGAEAAVRLCDSQWSTARTAARELVHSIPRKPEVHKDDFGLTIAVEIRKRLDAARFAQAARSATSY